MLTPIHSTQAFCGLKVEPKIILIPDDYKRGRVFCFVARWLERPKYTNTYDLGQPFRNMFQWRWAIMLPIKNGLHVSGFAKVVATFRRNEKWFSE